MNTKIETSEAPSAIGPYSQAVKAGNWLFVSGQLPADAKTGLLVEGSIQEMTDKVIDNLEAILKAAGLTLQDVVSTQVFLVDLSADFVPMNEAYSARFKGSVPPARATVEVSKLPKGARVEISCIAVV